MRAFTLGLNAAKFTDYNKNASSKSCSELEVSWRICLSSHFLVSSMKKA